MKNFTQKKWNGSSSILTIVVPLILLVFFFTITSVQAQLIINPVAVTTSLAADFETDPFDLVNGEGLTDFPSITASHASSVVGNSLMYFNGSNTIIFDLGGNFSIEGLACWNGTSDTADYGIQDVVVSSSEDGINYTTIPDGPTVFAEATAPPNAAEIFSFNTINATHIRIEALNNHGNFLMTILSEIAFLGASQVDETVINPISATTTLTAQFGSTLDNTINGTGLDAFPSLSAEHEATTPMNSFLATNEAGSIDFDLGGSYLVDGLSFWNEGAPGPGATGIQEVIISSSQDGVNYTPIDGAPGTFSQVMAPTSPAEQFSFDAVTASFIRFDVVSNYGDPGNLVAFAELAFSGIETIVIEENVINPVSATTTLSAQFGSTLDNTINGSGLDAFPSLSAEHEATTPMNSFLATNEAGSIDFDLGGYYLVDGLSFWNEGAPGPGATGIQEVIISSSQDGVNYTPIDGAPGTFSQVMTPTSPAEQFSFNAVTASFIRFDVVSNYGDPGNLVAFAELAFSGVMTTGITENMLAEAVNVYPNPAQDVITIHNNSNIKLDGIQVFDIYGRLVKQIDSVDNNTQTINISDLSSGTYIIQVYNEQLKTIKRVIKK